MTSKKEKLTDPLSNHDLLRAISKEMKERGNIVDTTELTGNEDLEDVKALIEELEIADVSTETVDRLTVKAAYERQRLPRYHLHKGCRHTGFEPCRGQ